MHKVEKTRVSLFFKRQVFYNQAHQVKIVLKTRLEKLMCYVELRPFFERNYASHVKLSKLVYASCSSADTKTTAH